MCVGIHYVFVLVKKKKRIVYENWLKSYMSRTRIIQLYTKSSIVLKNNYNNEPIPGFLYYFLVLILFQITTGGENKIRRVRGSQDVRNAAKNYLQKKKKKTPLKVID